MEQALEGFFRACKETLEASSGPEGRAALVAVLRKAVADPVLRAACFGAEQPGRREIYRDPALGFCVLAYDMPEPRVSPPHDHGPSWAIYGQCAAHTDMTEFERDDGGSGPGPARLAETRRYRLAPGEAALFDIGVIHRIDYPAGARFLRISGEDMEAVPRMKYDLEAGEAIAIAGTSVPG